MKFKTILIALVGVLLFSAAKVNAQTTTFTPSHLKAAERMIVASQIESNLQKMFTALIETQSQQLPIDKRAPFKSAMNKFIAKYVTFEDVKKAFIPIYAETYSEQELNQIADFLSSPAGIKMTSRQTELFQKGGAWGQKVFTDHQAELEQMMKDEMAKK
ncbi:DUF2059 domain-containing protein [Mucilaginibacter flavus]|uniref:DUF2059 domain-containing protein n=1 Tax=Mucilaginibacter flavus TaxID=931504 RepID=UPI0025B592E5|nr:DUF2059 domain-containing protein [Mucilaginibacter flavus]MDN3581780.1 DUF2059 domain-containing protein [Mucilaginibacter flavus]